MSVILQGLKSPLLITQGFTAAEIISVPGIGSASTQLVQPPSGALSLMAVTGHMTVVRHAAPAQLVPTPSGPLRRAN